MAVIFRHLVKGGSFSACWRLADVVPVPKESSSYNVGDSRPISITPLLSNVFENIVLGKLSHALKSNSLLSPFHFSHRRGLKTCKAFFTLSHPLEVALDRGMERKACSVGLLSCI